MNYGTEPTDAELLVAAGLAPAVAARLLESIGGIAMLPAVTVAELRSAGAPARIASRLVASIALARRAGLRAADARSRAECPRAIYSLVWERAAALSVEAFWTICIDSRRQVIDIVEVGRGTVGHVQVHPREVFRPAIRCAAPAIVVAHNHPSGDPTPSNSDMELTRQLRQAATMLGIQLLDHVVVASRGYRSFAEIEGTSS